MNHAHEFAGCQDVGENQRTVLIVLQPRRDCSSGLPEHQRVSVGNKLMLRSVVHSVVYSFRLFMMVV